MSTKIAIQGGRAESELANDSADVMINTTVEARAAEATRGCLERYANNLSRSRKRSAMRSISV